MGKERILVCVNYGLHGERLINRGASIANQLNGPLFILVFDSLPEEDYKEDKSVDMSIFRELAEDNGAELIIEKSHPHNITKVITKVANDVDATQIIIGQTTESLWTTLIGGSIIDVLLADVPDADLHVVPKPRADETEDWDFERGVPAYLQKQSDGTYKLSFDNKKNADYEGIFFKHLNTDFNNGIFALSIDNRIYEVRVKDDIVYKIVDVDEE
ncbi:universal stress protein UspA [Natribacillus halophilus]|uniref:Two-component system, OmpR family, sensor histidine kinase KdpD n=1 Tax=Natribacillus halophilus TaxID=549003 RepID=A0A1G8S1E3_9BACI|nr:universal stress protein UspA [Natribacillus halophilus]SDJ23047.1 two-component system, OmpR family, sensor histidine kinase KdpD [Natribacillus halophilus]